MTGEQVPFYSMFPFLEENEVLKELLSGAMVRSVNVDRAARRMEVRASSAKMAAPVELHLIERKQADPEARPVLPLRHDGAGTLCLRERKESLFRRGEGAAGIGSEKI